MKIELPCGVAVNMFKALDGARANDKLRLALTGVYWEQVGGVHTFITCDSFRLHRVTVQESTAQYSQDILLSGDIVKAVQTCAKTIGKDGTVKLEIETMGDYDTHCLVSGVVKDRILFDVVVNTLSVVFPSCRSIIDGATDIELPALFNGKYFGGLVDAATLWAGKDSPITVESVHATKPSRIVSANEFGTFTGVVMPQRGGK
ncbi:hypothetical protein UFOVP668_35 [uncultured Caudovirales phage]|uniref:Uncharacterized protein n=1 Tax=uncultured Caudovirales phage TaxID=2100421 RepID=A0A6J5NB57_9CAUD|nr:hypothetical protein UFOVP668_35 [uncultured Caudovirales phage]